MKRRPRLIAQVALFGALAVLVFPADGSALRAVFVALTPTGPTPVVLTIPAGLYPVWRNTDQVAHTVVFANGLCSFAVPPGGYGQCSGFSGYVGSYPYTVDGTVQASVLVVAEGRAVTLTASRHGLTRGAQLTLHGELSVPILSPPAPPAPQPVIVLARHDRHHPFRPMRIVTATTHGWHLQWQLRVRPWTRTIYLVEAVSQPAGGRYWQDARSKPFEVLVRRPRPAMRHDR